MEQSAGRKRCNEKCRPVIAMPVLNVAFVGSEEFAKKIAKKGDVRDIESYVYKETGSNGVRILSLLRPLRHPERIRPLLSVLNVAKIGMVEITTVDAALGEVLVAFGAARITVGHAIINPTDGNWVDPNQVKMILSQAGLEKWQLHETMPDEHSLRESLLSEIDSSGENEALVIPIDQHFNVKGVGLVAIGYVQSGKILKHDEVTILPANEKGIARSLQVMDDDVGESVQGDRVGVALRNLREEALHRGCILIHVDSEAMIRHDKSLISIEKAPFQKRDLAIGSVIHAAVDLQFIVGRIVSIDGPKLTVEWEQPLWIRTKGECPVIIAQLDAGNMRIMGSVQHIEKVVN